MRKVLPIVVVSLAIAGCGSSTGPSNTAHSAVIDANTNLTFTPTPDTIAAGDTVRFTWHSVPHNVVWDATPAPVPNIGSGNTGFTAGDSIRVLGTPGTYAYHCDIHDGMTGIIVVR